MLILLAISSVLACDLLNLPPDLMYFSPAFDDTHKLEGSGRFLAPLGTIDWEIAIPEESWLRVSIETKHFSFLLTLKSSSLILSSEGSPQSSAMISHSLSPSIYYLKFTPDIFEQKNYENTGCRLPSLYFNIALYPLSHIKSISEIPSTYSQGFPELEILDNILEFSGFLAVYPDEYINLTPNTILHTYSFILPKTTENHEVVGITGLWRITFTLRNF
jgi:hypothetical protein